MQGAAEVVRLVPGHAVPDRADRGRRGCDAAVIVLTVQGTQQGEFFGVPVTGQHLESRLVLALRFENGLIAHVRRHPRTGQRRGDQDQPLVTSRPRYSQPNPAVLTTGQACPVAVTQRVPVFLGSLRFLADRRWHVACFSSWCLLACTAG
ncbi:MAG TPA: hypothetical protein EYM36_03650 [Acidobacteria bacterium]|nr:hypothetical protein [Acidobacteriota bacterium]